VVAVLSSDMGPYQDALAGFRETLGEPFTVVHLAREHLDNSALPLVVVAFGGKAATQKYAPGTVLIYCMAPGTYIASSAYDGRVFQVSMMPDAKSTLLRIKSLQPGLHRLGLLWASASDEPYIKELHHAASAAGVEISDDKMDQPAHLPERLRALNGRVDAFWVPADPLLINEQNLVLLAQFSKEARIPLYSPIAGLTERGALATVSSSYPEIGRTAASAVQQILKGMALSEEIYPPHNELAVNLQTASQLEVPIDQKVADQAAKGAP